MPLTPFPQAAHALFSTRGECYKRPVKYRILGPLEVSGIDPSVLRRPKPRALLALLLLHPNEVLSVDRIVEALWGEEPPAKAVGSLQNFVSALRKALGPEVLVTHPPGYVLRVDPAELDLARFESLVRQADGTPAAERAELLREALALWRGDPLSDLVDEPFAQSELRRLEELRLVALEERIDADLALGQHARVVGELESHVRAHPLRERFRGQLMLALYRSGRQADALQVYREGHRLFDEELGLEPGEELQRLERAILRHDPDLDVAVGAGAGTPLTRKLVTVLVALVTGDGEADTLREQTAQFVRELRAAVEYHGGSLEHVLGDEALAVFGVPVAHEDDAVRAARSALAARDALASSKLEGRFALEAGEIVAGAAATGAPRLTGDVVTIARGLAAAADAGEILVGPRALELAGTGIAAERAAGVSLRGREPVVPSRVVRAASGPVERRKRLHAPLAGRLDELAALRGAFDRACAERRCELAVVLGDPGIGKTRLAAELAHALSGEARTIVGRCVSYGAGATYLPLAHVVLQATEGRTLDDVLANEDDADEIAAQIRALVGGGEAAAGGEAFWAVRRFLEALAATRPLVLVLEDVHWAEPTFLDLVEYVSEWSAKEPLLVLAVARPELLERRPQWALNSGTRTVVELEPLPEADARKLVEDLAETLDLPPETRERVLGRAEGIPLYAEQLLAFASERGLDEAPPTLEALLASRLDALDASERAAIDCAAVVGRDFWRGAVVALAEDEHAVGTALMSLVRRNLVRPASSTLAREDGFRFHHELVRDVAYDGIPGTRRAELHARLADWLERRGDIPDELVGHHLEQAYHEHERMGGVGSAERHLAHEAGIHLANAGVRAFKQGDIPAARNLLERAVALLDEHDHDGLMLRSELAVVLWAGGDAEAGIELLEETIARAGAPADAGAAKRAQLELAHIRLYTDPKATIDQALAAARDALPTFELLGDERGLARAWVVLSLVEGSFLCRNEAWAVAAEQATEHYRRSGWPTRAPTVSLAAALYYGPTAVEVALGRCLALREDPAVGRAGAAEVGVYQAGLLAYVERFDEARALLDEAVSVNVELGQTLAIAIGADAIRGSVEALAGDLEAAEHALRSSCETCERLGALAHIATLGAELAQILAARGRLDEAERWAHDAEVHAEPGDLSAQFSWRSARATLLMHTDDLARARELAREAERIVLGTDAINQQGNVLVNLADVLAAAGQEEEARDAIERAVAAYELKGNLVAAQAARKAREGPFAPVRSG
jgi:DNA-binding SARP family transcriptional activator